jgi:hypothetical protein
MDNAHQHGKQIDLLRTTFFDTVRDLPGTHAIFDPIQAWHITERTLSPGERSDKALVALEAMNQRDSLCFPLEQNHAVIEDSDALVVLYPAGCFSIGVWHELMLAGPSAIVLTDEPKSFDRSLFARVRGVAVCSTADQLRVALINAGLRAPAVHRSHPPEPRLGFPFVV